MSKFEKGVSGNPAGRPSHAVTAAKLRELITADDVQDILTAVITQAKTGDMTAAKLILDKVLPSLKSVDTEDKAEDGSGKGVIFVHNAPIINDP